MDLSVEQLEAVEVLADRAVSMDRIAERTGLPLETVEFVLYGPVEEEPDEDLLREVLRGGI